MTNIKGTPATGPLPPSVSGNTLINAESLGLIHLCIPGVRSVNLYPRNAGSVTGNGVMSKAEKRPIDDTEKKASDISVETESCIFHVWPSTFSDTTYDPKVFHLVEESDGTRWEVKSVRREMLESRLKLTVIQLFEKTT